MRERGEEKHQQQDQNTNNVKIVGLGEIGYARKRGRKTPTTRSKYQQQCQNRSNNESCEQEEEK